MQSCCAELEKPPSRNNMGVLQIIQLVIMIIVGILCCYDIYNELRAKVTFWSILALIADVLFILGIVFIIIGLFCGFTTNKIRIGIYCFFVAIIIEIVFIVFCLINSGGLDYWLLNLVKAIVMIFIAYILWKQSLHV